MASLGFAGKAHATQLGKAPSGFDATSTATITDITDTTSAGFEAGVNEASVGRYVPDTISSQIFGGSAPLSLDLDADGFEPGGNGIWLELHRPLRYDFGIDLMLTGAEFRDVQVSAITYALTEDLADPAAAANTDGGTVTHSDGSAADCMAFPRSDTVIRLRGCGATGEDAPAKLIKITGIELQSISGLATPGHAITLSADVFDPTLNEVDQSAPAITILTSANTVMANVRAPGAVTVDPDSDPPFSKILSGNPATAAKVGTLTFATPMTATNAPIPTLDNTGSPVTAASLVSGAQVSVEHPAFDDEAFKEVALGDPSSRATPKAPTTRTPIEDGAATFTVSETIFGSHDINIVFNGEDPISSSAAGTVMVEFNAAAGKARSHSIPPDAVGDLARINRGGLSAQVNGARNSATDGSTLYRSFLRITNNGGLAGPVTITVRDAGTGEILGTPWTSPSDIMPNAMLQISVADLEAGTGIAPPTRPGLYVIDVDGPINGYVQHVNWNSVDGLFSDLSGFRSGALTRSP